MGIFFNGMCQSKARLDGKVVIITGSNTGIGKATACNLTERGAEVIMACRNVQKAEEAAEDIRQKVPSAKLVVIKLDLSSFASVRDFCKEFSAKYHSLHLLINNAGVLLWQHSLSEDGFEMHFATNHLGHFLLTLLLLPTIIKSAPSRIINVSSVGHILSNSIDFNDVNLEKSYLQMMGYPISKLANILFTLELSNRLKGTDVKAVSLHPGVVDTQLAHSIGTTFFPFANWLSSQLSKWLLKSPEQGAQTTLHCALDENIQSGLYYSNCAEARPSSAAMNTELAKELWDKSVEFVKLGDYDPFLVH